MSGQLLDYTIANKNKIKTSQGNIEQICQKNSKGFQIEDVPDKFTFELKLKQKSVVNIVECKPFLGDEIVIELIGEQNKVIETIVKQISDKPVFIHQCKDSSERQLGTTKIKVQIYNKSGVPSSVGLFYIMIWGNKVPEVKGPRNISKKPEKDFFQEADLSPHKVPVKTRLKDKDVFADRNKSKINDRGSNKRFEEQTLKAIELSKQDQQIKKKSEVNEEEYIEQIEQMKPREYTRFDYEKYKKIFQYVNSSWVEAQRKIEIEKGVPEEERLSNAIQVRHFHNKVFCIDVTPRATKQQLIKLCEQMGGKVKEEVCENCLLITNNLDTERVARAKKLKNVKILKPDFIGDCQKVGAYLDERDYFFKH